MSDLTLEGRLERDAFGGPVFVLRSDAGQSWQLKGAVPTGLVGRRVRVRGVEAAAQFGFAMVGPVVEVGTIEPLD